MANRIEDARRVKPKVAAMLREIGVEASCGLTKVDGFYAVKVSMAESSAVLDGAPLKIDGVPIIYRVIGRVVAR